MTTDEMNNDEFWMTRALALAHEAEYAGEVPVGAVVVVNGQVIGEGYNHPIAASDATAHAEIDALRNASQAMANYRLPGATLYVTIEPCTMCVGAMIHARIERLVFGAREPRAGAVISAQQLLNHTHYNHRISWSEGVLAQDCAQLMRAFFRRRRSKSGTPDLNS